MKKILKEQLKVIKTLMEATDSSSSGSYEEPMGFDNIEPIDGLVGIEISSTAPDIEVVDVTQKEDLGHEGQSCAEAHQDISHEEWEEEPIDDMEEIDTEEIFNTLGLFTENTKPPIKEYYEDTETETWDEEEIIGIAKNGPKRDFRVLIGYQGIVPETDDVEYDRKVAEWLVDQERGRLKNMETWSDKVEFKSGNLLNPFY